MNQEQSPLTLMPRRVRSVPWTTIVGLVVAAMLAVAACTSETTPGVAFEVVPEAGEPAGPHSTDLPTPDGPLTVNWAVVMSGSTNQDEIDGVAAGADGSVFITGKFEATTAIGDTVLTSDGAADIPLARIDADGTVMWARRFGGGGEDNFFDIDANATIVVATGIISGQVEFDSVTVTSAGGTDCVIAAFDYSGAVVWVTTLGGPGDDGCNEVSVATDGSVTTSLDTSGGWNSPAGPLPNLAGRDTVLVRLDPDGNMMWARRIGGDGVQRGKALAVAPDGSVAFGGDTLGPATSDEMTLVPTGRRRSGWLSKWSPEGTLQWWNLWDGPGVSLVKGLTTDGSSVTAVGPFTGALTVGDNALDASGSTDLAIVRYNGDGSAVWATSISADGDLTGAEIVSTADGGIVFGGSTVPGLRFGQSEGQPLALTNPDDGSAWLARYCPDGGVALATSIAGTVNARPGELALGGETLFLDMVVRGADNIAAGRPIAAVGKDASVWSFTLPTASGC